MASRPFTRSVQKSFALQVANLTGWMKHFAYIATTGDLSQEAQAAAYAKLLGAAATAFMCPIQSECQPPAHSPRLPGNCWRALSATVGSASILHLHRAGNTLQPVYCGSIC